MKIAIVKAKWNSDITNLLADTCKKRLKELETENLEILEYEVSGAVELPVMAKNIINYKKVDAVVAIAVVLKGETDHNIFVAQQASYGCQKVAIETSIPVVFGVLTTENKELALNRANGKHSFSGIEWAETAVDMVKSIKSLK